jgi:transposase
MLWEMSVAEQRYRAVLEVGIGVPVTEVAERYGVSRQSVHAALDRYPGLARGLNPHAGTLTHISVAKTFA